MRRHVSEPKNLEILNPEISNLNYFLRGRNPKNTDKNKEIYKVNVYFTE